MFDQFSVEPCIWRSNNTYWLALLINIARDSFIFLSTFLYLYSFFKNLTNAW
ncbi:hypothetical protein mflW37_4090 [Mesoplasma florum W37]|nr:hypothetical protein mflW37_4090 [Mesoplasma florum W37]